MTMKYRFRTSKGYVYLEFDLADFAIETWPTRDNYGKPNGGTISVDRCKKFTITEGAELLYFEWRRDLDGKVFWHDGLYDGSVGWIERIDGLLWAKIELSDGMYGCPEYLLEQVS